jgi:pimeloyl-ACP methyl ester carboxylesterase
MAYDLAEPVVTENRFHTQDGMDIFYRDYAPVAPETGLPVVCLHGLTRNSRDFELVAPRIASLGRRVIALDMRGRGNSSRDPSPEHYAPAMYVYDVLNVLDSLVIPRAAFVGTSMGGIITMLLAKFAAPRIAAAVLNDIGPVIEEAGLKRIAAYVGQNMEYASWAEAERAIAQSQAAAFPKAPPEFFRKFARRTCRQLPDGRVAFDYDPAIARPAAETAPVDMTPLFEALAPAPILVVRGALSDLFSAEGVDLMRIVKQDLLAVEVPDVGHAPTLEEPQAWDAIVDFLAHVP